MVKLIKGKQIQTQTITINGTSGHVSVMGDLDMSNFQVLTSQLPSTDNALANKAYVDAVAQGVTPHAPVKVVLTANTTLTGEGTFDGVALVSGDRVLVAGQTTATENGIYVVDAGAWTRADDADGTPSFEVSKGDFVFIEGGVLNGGSGWVLAQSTATTNTIVVGTETQVWYKMAAPGTYTTDGQGIELNGNIINLEIDGDTLSKSATGLKLSDTLLSRISTSEVGITSLETLVSTEVSTRTSAVVSLETLITNLATTDTINQNIIPTISGSTNNVILTASAFVFASGTIDVDSVSIHLNGVQYPFATALGTSEFYTIGTPVAGTGTTLYFDGTVAGFAIETDDVINLKFNIAL